MLYWLFYEVIYKNNPETLSFLRLFQYTTFRGSMAIITSFVLTLVIGPYIIRYLRAQKLGQPIRELGPASHQSKSGTPTMGGIMIIISVFISTLLFAKLNTQKTLILLYSILAFGLIGFLDDYLKLIKKHSDGLSAKLKLLGQFLVASTIVIALFLHIDIGPTGESRTYGEIFIPFFAKPILDLSYFFIPFGIIFLMSTSNAVNLTDGLDGLAIVQTIFVVGAFIIISYLVGHVSIAQYLKVRYIPGSPEISVFGMALMGACIGFLWFNSHPAEVFMGDTGSLALGGTLGVMAILVKKEFLLVIAGGVFVVEAASVVIQILYFKATKKRFFKMAPLHHHFEESGLPESKVIIRFWIAGAILVMIALATLKIQ